jgi:hypothetical protein
VELYDDGVTPKGEFSHMIEVPQPKNMTTCGVLGETTLLEEGFPPSQPLKTQPVDNHHCEATKEFRLAKDHVNLIFEVKGEVFELNFKV